MKYAVYSLVGVYWDGGVRLEGHYRWFWQARLACWWHVRVENPMRVGYVVSTFEPLRWFNSHSEFFTWLKNHTSQP